MFLDELGGATSQLVSFTLDAILRRQDVIANNVANAETSGYSVKSLDFQQVLRQYFDTSNGRFNEAAFVQDVQRLKQEMGSLEYVKTAENQPVKLDEQMVLLTENVLHYQALLEASSKRGAILRLAISGGRSE